MNIKFIHFSHYSDLKVLDPAFWNSNDLIKNGEAERIKHYDAPLRIYAYFGAKPQAISPEVGLGPFIYTGWIDDIYNMSDYSYALQTAKRLAEFKYPTSFKVVHDEVVYDTSKGAPVEPGSVFSLFEREIKACEFSGYLTSDLICIFRKVAVERV